MIDFGFSGPGLRRAAVRRRWIETVPSARARRPRLVLLAFLAVTLSGCAVIGPHSIGAGRQAYAEAIIQTDNQQLLLSVIRTRYSERSSLLAVSSVTANVRVVTDAGVELGFGDDENYVGNLIPFSGGFVYEENPTISYTPLKGEEYLRYILAPVPLYALAQVTSTLVEPRYLYEALISNVNGIYNPDFYFTAAEPDPRFDRFVELMIMFQRANRLHWVARSDAQQTYALVFENFRPEYVAELEEFMNLVGLPEPGDDAHKVEVPVFLALDGRPAGGIGIVTRSAYDLLEILSGAIEVPEEDQRRGITMTFPEPARVGRNLRVQYSKHKPDDASVAVAYSDGWFYIDKTDLDTKRFFKLLGTLWSIAISKSSGAKDGAPVLTVPVSR